MDIEQLTKELEGLSVRKFTKPAIRQALTRANGDVKLALSQLNSVWRLFEVQPTTTEDQVINIFKSDTFAGFSNPSPDDIIENRLIGGDRSAPVVVVQNQPKQKTRKTRTTATRERREKALEEKKTQPLVQNYPKVFNVEKPDITDV